MRATVTRGSGICQFRRSTTAILIAVLIGAGVAAGAPVAAAADVTPPELNIAAEFIMGPVSTDHLLLQISEPIDLTSIPDASDFAWHAIVPGPCCGPPPPPDVPASGLTFLYEGMQYDDMLDLFPTGMSLLRLDLGATVDPAATVFLTYTPGTHRVRDLAGNEMAAFSGIGGVFLDEPILADDITPIVDDGRGPDHVLLTALQPFGATMPPAVDFEVRINAVGHTPLSVTRQIPGSGLGVVDLELGVSVAAGDVVDASYTPSATPLRYLTGDPVPAFASIPALISLPATPSRGTPVGSNVVVTPADATTGAPTASITFATVTTAGITTVESSPTGPAAPAGFTFGDPAIFYDLATTASFTNATVCFEYDPADFTAPETGLRLLHFAGGAWVDSTVPGSPDVINHRILRPGELVLAVRHRWRGSGRVLGVLLPGRQSADDQRRQGRELDPREVRARRQPRTRDFYGGLTVGAARGVRHRSSSR